MTRSSDAMPDWKTLSIEASWVSGIEKVREYWMKACTSPTLMAPLATCSPPTTATITYCTLPMNIVAGCMRLDMNWAPNDDSNSSSLVRRKRSSTSDWRPNALTTACPVKVSSIWALSAPVLRHCDRYLGRARAAMSRITRTDSGTVTSATTASSGEMVNITAATPTSSSTEVSIWLSVCWRLWATLSRSLVTRLSRSPRAWRSMYERGRALSLASARARNRNMSRC